MNQFEVNELLGQNLRTANSNLIWLYLENAIHTAGDEADFKYFVARILDLMHSQTQEDQEDRALCR